MDVGKVHMAMAGLSVKSLGALGIPAAAILSGLAEFGFTNQWGSAGLAGVIGGCFVAVIAFGPKWMEARRKAIWSQSEIEQTQTDKTIERFEKIMERQASFFRDEIAAKDRQIAFYQTVAAERDLIATLERNSKHAVLSQLTTAEIKLLKPEAPHTNLSYGEMVGDNDKEITESKKRITLALPVAATT